MTGGCGRSIVVNLSIIQHFLRSGLAIMRRCFQFFSNAQSARAKSQYFSMAVTETARCAKVGRDGRVILCTRHARCDEAERG